MAKGAYTVEFSFRGKRFQDADKGLRYFGQAIKQDYEKVGPVLKKDLELWLQGVAARMVKDHSGKWPGGTTGKTLSKRSGRGLQSIVESIKVTGDKPSDIQGHIGGVFYLRTQEFGATIRPKKAKYLAVPLPSALNENGVPLRPGPRDWENTFVKMSKSGHLMIFRKLGKDIIPLYILLKEVTIPPRLGMRDTLNAGMGAFVDMAMADMLKALKGG
jgi:hypothetical protein